MSIWTVTLVLGALHVSRCSSEEFLSAGPGEAQSRAQQVAFLEQLEDIFGSSHREATESRLAEITEALRNTFASLPKNTRGAVSASSARYAIHRLFVQRHGWHVKGLASATGDRSASGPALGMGDLLPERLQNLIEEQLAHDDFHLREIAVLSATVEALIHGEAVGRLERTYKALHRDMNGGLTEQDAMQLIDTYMAFFVAGYNISQFAPAKVHTLRNGIAKTWEYWKHTSDLVREMQQQVAHGISDFAFPDVLNIIEAVHERLGRRVDEGNCHDIESRLIRIEEASGTGRVRVRDFYSSYLHEGTWQFQERIDYLRHLGVLDESDPAVSRVIIPNYLNMQANCLNVSSFYDLCCIDSCEALLGHVEGQVQAPHATPEEIIDLVSALPSAHVPGNRTLSSALVTKLHEVAQHHGGHVPLHGRLFAQWMHFAYPRECPYPHISGTTKLLTEAAWSLETGMKSAFTRDEMQSYINASIGAASGSAPSGGQEEDEGVCSSDMWAPEEELVDAVNGKPPLPIWPAVHAALRACAFLAVLVCSALAIRSLASQALDVLAEAGGAEPLLAKLAKMGFCGAKGEKYMV